MSIKQQKLFEIIRDKELGDERVKLIKELTEDGDFLGDIFAGHGENLLHFAAGEGLYKLLDYLYNKGVYVNHSNHRNATPMYYATLNKDPKILKWFVDKKANPRITSSFSGKNVTEAVNSKDSTDPIMAEVIKYCNEYEKKMKDPRFHYLQKFAEDHTFSMMIILHPRGESFCAGYMPRISMTLANETKGIEGMIDLCKIADNKMWRDFDDRECISCQNKTDEKCPYCKNIPICKNCIKDPTKSTEIHTNLCEQGYFESDMSLKAWSNRRPTSGIFDEFFNSDNNEEEVFNNAHMNLLNILSQFSVKFEE